MNWQPYRFEDTSHYRRAEVHATNEITRLAPGPDAIRSLRSAVGKILQDLGGEDAVGGEATDHTESLSIHDRLVVRTNGSESQSEWSGGNYPARFVFSLGSKPRQAVLEVPLASARSLISRVVDVPAERLGASDLLTPVEQGVLAFFGERISAGLAERCGFLGPLAPIVLEAIENEQGAFDPGSDGPNAWHTLTGTVRIAGLIVPYCLRLPWKAIAREEMLYEAGEDHLEKSRRRADTFGKRLNSARLSMTGRVATIPLTAGDFDQLEVNDIVRFETDELADGLRFENHLEGRFELAYGGLLPESGLIVTEVIEDNDRGIRLEIRDLQPGQLIPRKRTRNMEPDQDPTEAKGPDVTSVPSQSVTSGPNDPTSTDPSAATAEGRAMTQEAPLHLRVEVGRLQLTLRELSSLRVGSILELQKDPSEPVSLVVEDRVLGKGELVRIEGELGVRILSLS